MGKSTAADTGYLRETLSCYHAPEQLAARLHARISSFCFYSFCSLTDLIGMIRRKDIKSSGQYSLIKSSGCASPHYVNAV